MLPSDEWMHQSVDLVFSAPHFTERNYTGLKSRLEALYPRTDFESGVQRVSAIYTDLIFFCPSKAYVHSKCKMSTCWRVFRYAKKIAAQGARVHFYLFGREAEYGNPFLHAYHNNVLYIFTHLICCWDTIRQSYLLYFKNQYLHFWADYCRFFQVIFPLPNLHFLIISLMHGSIRRYETT